MIKLSRNRWIVFLLACIQFIILSDYLVFMPMGPTLMKSFEISTSQFASLVSIYSVGAIVIAFTTAGFLDRLDRLSALKVAFLLFIGISAVHLWAHNYSMLILLRFLAGGLAGLCGTLVMSVIAQIFESNRRGRIIGIVLSATSVAQIIGIPLGLSLINRFKWSAPFAFNAILGVFVMLLLLRLKISPREKTKEMLEKIPVAKQILLITRQPFHLKAMLCTLLAMSAGTIIVPFLPLLLVYKYGIAEDSLGLIYLIAGIAAFIASLIAGKISEKGTGKAAIYLIFSLGIIPLFIFVSMNQMEPWTVVSVFTCCNALFVVRMIPINKFIMDYIHPEYLSGFQSINTALLHIGASSAAYIGGIIISVDGESLNGFSLATILSSGVLLILFPLVHMGFQKQTAHLRTEI